MKNKQEKLKNAFNGVFSSELKPISSYQVEEYQPIETKKEEVQIKEEKKEIVKQEKIETKKEISKKEKQETTRKTFNIPIDIAEDMGKVVYMNRDIKDNTELLILALKKYLNSKENRELIEEYDTLKGTK